MDPASAPMLPLARARQVKLGRELKLGLAGAGTHRLRRVELGKL